MKSKIFYTNVYKEIEQSSLNLLNTKDNFLTRDTLKSTRATGDAIENILVNSFEKILGDLCANYEDKFSRRDMADFAFTDTDGFHYYVDIKTHRTNTDFSMPNLTSVKRLSDFYKNDINYFVILMVSYHLIKSKVVFTNVQFVPIEFLKWNCLTIGALGWGQIQIKNSKYIAITYGYSRKDWMLEFCKVVSEFYPKEITKIKGRIEHFEKTHQHWLSKLD